MTREEARAELDACTLRPGDASEEARAYAAQDPELSKWLAERTQFDEAVAATLKPGAISPEVTANLLAAMQAAAPPAPRQTMRWRGFPAQARVWLAAAAAVTLMALGWWWQQGSPAGGGVAWQTEALDLIAQVDSGELEVDHGGGDLANLKAFLAKENAPVPGELPAGITGMPGMACKVVQVSGRPASIVCFLIAPHQEAHLIVMNNQGLAPAPAGKPAFSVLNGWHTASWSSGGQNYLLATQADEGLLRKLFAGLLHRRRALFALLAPPW